VYSFNGDGTYKEYSKGQVVFKNNLDKIGYIVEHASQMSSLMGISFKEFNDNKRDLGKMKKYLSILESSREIGNPSLPMQMYISRHDNNVGSTTAHEDWVDYIMTQNWVDDLSLVASERSSSEDYRIRYLSTLIQSNMKDHELDYHVDLQDFQEDDFLDKGRTKDKNGQIYISNPFVDTLNMLNSFRKLGYGFYEMFKPISGGNGKYLKLKTSTDGTLDLTGVIGLSDCEHLKWEHGSMDYLRSLNTGNQRYLFKISRPFNDLSEDNPLGSNLWWKPDLPEPIQQSSPEQDGAVKLRYYKPYETERFLRWFGTTYVPLFDDVDDLEKVTVCSAPILDSESATSESFHNDATNIAANGGDIGRSSVESPSTALLSIFPKATIKVRNLMDDKHEGQYLEFIVSGGQ